MPPGLEPMTFSHTVWATQIAAVADLPDERLDKRLTAILVDTIPSKVPPPRSPRRPAMPARHGHLSLLCQ